MKYRAILKFSAESTFKFQNHRQGKDSSFDQQAHPPLFETREHQILPHCTAWWQHFMK